MLVFLTGVIDHFLSWRGFLPLSRLTYCVYLIHYDYLNVFYSLNRRILYYTFIDQLTTFFGIVVSVFALAFVVSVSIEASFMNLERLVFSTSMMLYIFEMSSLITHDILFTKVLGKNRRTTRLRRLSNAT